MRQFTIAVAVLAFLAGCTEPEVAETPPEETGPEIVPLNVPLATE